MPTWRGEAVRGAGAVEVERAFAPKRHRQRRRDPPGRRDRHDRLANGLAKARAKGDEVAKAVGRAFHEKGAREARFRRLDHAPAIGQVDRQLRAAFRIVIPSGRPTAGDGEPEDSGRVGRHGRFEPPGKARAFIGGLLKQRVVAVAERLECLALLAGVLLQGH